MKDSWNIESPAINLDDPVRKLTEMMPYRRAEDKKGHGTPLVGWFPKDILRRVVKLREVGPYETNGDVARDAMWIGLQVLELRYQCDPDWVLYSQLTKMANEAEWELEAYKEEDSFAESLEKIFSGGDEDHAVELLQDRMHLIGSNPGSSKRKEALLQGIRRHRLTGLLEKVKTS